MAIQVGGMETDIAKSIMKKDSHLGKYDGSCWKTV